MNGHAGDAIGSALDESTDAPQDGRNGRDELASAGVEHDVMSAASPAPPGSVDASGPVASRATSIEDIIREHSGAMYRVALSVVRDHALAEDVVQESVVKAWQALDSFRGDSSVRTWLLRITHNTAISALRKRRDDVIAPDELPERPGHTSVEESALLQADRDEIWRALSRLDPVSRAIVVLREVDRMAYEEIAEILDLPTPTVRTRLFRARQQLVRTSTARTEFASGRSGSTPSADRREGGAA